MFTPHVPKEPMELRYWMERASLPSSSFFLQRSPLWHCSFPTRHAWSWHDLCFTEVWFRTLPMPRAKAEVDEPLRASLAPAVSKWTPEPVVEPVALPVPEPADVEEPEVIEELAETKLVQGKEYTGAWDGSNLILIAMSSHV